jgi:EAL domain-containing protein (putative c-di-GMP-specific phosphodiesterase class I)
MMPFSATASRRIDPAMGAQPAQSRSAAIGVPAEVGGARTPLCYVIDSDPSIRHFLSLILHGVGIDTEEFEGGQGLIAALTRRAPDVIFLDIPIESADAIGCVIALGNQGYRGRVQLMSSRGSAVLAHVKSIGEQQRLQMLPPLRKPFETNAVLKLLQEHNLGHPPAVAGRIDLHEALAKGWIEFWYQPKIDLRKKQLVGAEAFARAPPASWRADARRLMPGASESGLITLSELALAHALKACLGFAQLGVNLRMAVNMPVNALVKLDIAGIVQTYRPKFKKWPGLIIDVTEEQIVTDLALATDFTAKLAHLNVKLAIDDFGRGYSSLIRLKALPFAELKLDRAFVTDCGSDKVNAPLCKTVIDLAHNFDSVAVAIGIEKASDALALVSMGCDYGQGFLLGQPMPEERFGSLLRQRATSQARNAVSPARAMESGRPEGPQALSGSRRRAGSARNCPNRRCAGASAVCFQTLRRQCPRAHNRQSPLLCCRTTAAPAVSCRPNWSSPSAAR